MIQSDWWRKNAQLPIGVQTAQDHKDPYLLDCVALAWEDVPKVDIKRGDTAGWGLMHQDGKMKCIAKI